MAIDFTFPPEIDELRLKVRGFVARSRSLGASDSYIIRRHILPHVAPLLVAQTVLAVPIAVFFEAALAFVGLGVRKGLI